MHYYKRNIGDYAKKAGRLSMLQHGAYTLLLDTCYDREQFPTKEEAIEWTWASTTAEIEAVEFVLRKFFTLEDGVYIQKRIKEELEEYHSKSQTNKRIAQERETKRREKSTKRVPDVHEPPPNHKPLTINQEPLLQDTKVIPSPSRAGAVCVALRSEGCIHTNPDHPKLLALLNDGAEIDDFIRAWRVAKDSGKSNFAYALGIVKREREDAQNAVTQVGAKNEFGGRDNRSRAKRVADKFDEIGRASLARERILGGGDREEVSSALPAPMDVGGRRT